MKLPTLPLRSRFRLQKVFAPGIQMTNTDHGDFLQLQPPPLHPHSRVCGNSASIITPWTPGCHRLGKKKEWLCTLGVVSLSHGVASVDVGLAGVGGCGLWSRCVVLKGPSADRIAYECTSYYDVMYSSTYVQPKQADANHTCTRSAGLPCPARPNQETRYRSPSCAFLVPSFVPSPTLWHFRTCRTKILDCGSDV
jgi:hypothetical protein